MGCSESEGGVRAVMKTSSMNRLKLTGLTLLLSGALIANLLYLRIDPFRDPARYRQAFSDLESSSASSRMSALHEVLDPIDWPLPGVKPQTRLAIDMMLGDEDESVRIRAAMLLALVASTDREQDPRAYRRIIVAISRAMAEDASSDCRYVAANALEWHVVGRHYVDRDTAKLCEPYWRKAARDRDKDVAELAESYIATVFGRK